MGSNISITQKNYQETKNNIVQKSIQHCVNTCTTTAGIDFICRRCVIDGSVTLGRRCYVTGNSCNLKAAMDSTLLNTQKSEQDATIAGGDMFDVGGMLDTILGSKKSVTQENYQLIANYVSQTMETICGNKSEANSEQNFYDFTDAIVRGSVSNTTEENISYNNCISENLGFSYAENSQANDQSARIEGSRCGDALAGVLGIIVIAIAVVIAVFIRSTSRVVTSVIDAPGKIVGGVLPKGSNAGSLFSKENIEGIKKAYKEYTTKK